MSKVMHEAAFRELGLDHTYGLFDVTPEDLELFMENANFRGLNVTIPLKVAVVRFVDELSRDAAIIGSVNTIEFGGQKIGHNTDAAGFIKALEEEGVDVKDQTFLVMGAGGAGRAITFKLALEKARAYNFDKDSAKSKALSSEVLKKVGVRVESVGGVEDVIRKVDVVVNATPVGMRPNMDDSLVPKGLLHDALTVVDIVYNPLETRLLREAKAAGCKTVGGAGMLVHQGAEALRIWLKVDPPVEAMRRAVLDNLRT